MEVSKLIIAISLVACPFLAPGLAHFVKTLYGLLKEFESFHLYGLSCCSWNEIRYSSKPVMPFTFSHPAIVLPFHALFKRLGSLTALITGSIMPDFEAFLRMYWVKDHSHTWLGILWFSLPVETTALFQKPMLSWLISLAFTTSS